MQLTDAQKMYIAALWNRQEAFEYLTSECEVEENEANEFCQNVETEIKRALRFRVAEPFTPLTKSPSYCDTCAGYGYTFNPRKKKCTACNGKGKL